MTSRRLIARSTIIGAALGSALALCLLWAGEWRSGEPMEGAVMIAYLLAMPLALLADALNWGHYASQWIAFIGLFVPANLALLGAVVGALLTLRRR